MLGQHQHCTDDSNICTDDSNICTDARGSLVPANPWLLKGATLPFHEEGKAIGRNPGQPGHY